jgi:hypothetical protein
MANKALLILPFFLFIMLAGCATQDTQIHSPPPSYGAEAVYENSEGEELTSSISDRPKTVINGFGESTEAFTVSMAGEAVNSGHGPGRVYLVDTATNRIEQVVNPCVISDGNECNDFEFVYWKKGAPWLFGSSFFMDSTLRAGEELEMSYPGYNGTPTTSTYEVRGVSEDEVRVRPESTNASGGPDLVFGQPEVSSTWVDGSAFPVEIVVYGDTNIRFRLTEVREGQTPVNVSRPWEQSPSPGSHRWAPVDRGPPTSTAFPNSFSLSEARRHVEENDTRSRNEIDSMASPIPTRGLYEVPRDESGVADRLEEESWTWRLTYTSFDDGSEYAVTVTKKDSRTGTEYSVENREKRTISKRYEGDEPDLPGEQVPFDKGIQFLRNLDVDIQESALEFRLTESSPWSTHWHYRYMIRYRADGTNQALEPTTALDASTGWLDLAFLPDNQTGSIN